jgi:hypothetical protein
MAGIGDAIGGFAGGLAEGLEARKEGGSLVDRVKKVFKRTPDYSQEAMTPLPEGQEGPVIPSKRVPLRKGGRVPKTGIYQVHKGEVVIPAKMVKEIERVGRKKARKSSRSGGRR